MGQADIREVADQQASSSAAEAQGVVGTGRPKKTRRRPPKAAAVLKQGDGSSVLLSAKGLQQYMEYKGEDRFPQGQPGLAHRAWDEAVLVSGDIQALRTKLECVLQSDLSQVVRDLRQALAISNATKHPFSKYDHVDDGRANIQNKEGTLDHGASDSAASSATLDGEASDTSASERSRAKVDNAGKKASGHGPLASPAVANYSSIPAQDPEEEQLASESPCAVYDRRDHPGSHVAEDAQRRLGAVEAKLAFLLQGDEDEQHRNFDMLLGLHRTAMINVVDLKLQEFRLAIEYIKATISDLQTQLDGNVKAKIQDSVPATIDNVRAHQFGVVEMTDRREASVQQHQQQQVQDATQEQQNLQQVEEIQVQLQWQLPIADTEASWQRQHQRREHNHSLDRCWLNELDDVVLEPRGDQRPTSHTTERDEQPKECLLDPTTNQQLHEHYRSHHHVSHEYERDELHEWYEHTCAQELPEMQSGDRLEQLDRQECELEGRRVALRQSQLMHQTLWFELRALKKGAPLKCKLVSFSLCVPTFGVSVVDLAGERDKATTYAAICREVMRRPEGNMNESRGERSEVIGRTHFETCPISSTFDADGIIWDPTFKELVAFYDNEFLYAYRWTHLTKASQRRLDLGQEQMDLVAAAADDAIEALLAAA